MATGNFTLPSAIVEEILLLLPYKCIHRFRSVSKSWSSLLVSEEFQKLRFKSSPPELNVQKILHSFHGCYGEDYGMPLESFDYRGGEETCTQLFFPVERRFLKLIGSCNGLVCLTQESLVNNYRDIFLWNPFTGVYRKLPHTKGMSGRYGVYRAYGFGYDSVADDYKVFLAVVRRVSIRNKVRRLYPVVQIFSLKTGSWKSVKNPDRCLQDILKRDSVGLFLNGALHWSKRDTAKITAFDLVKETFYDVPPPPEQEGLGYRGIGGMVGGYLCAPWYLAPRSEPCVVWVMKEYMNKKSWVPFIESYWSYSNRTHYAFVSYKCNLIPYHVKDGDLMMLDFCDESQATEVLEWSKNPGKSDSVRVKYYHCYGSIPYTEALTSPYPASEVDQGF
ncbi:hypothetical protein Tsubulata_023034 [Turnera subulata]|uniref:F-box domain-containing protein n=1 Tax=Turnera subulata TaxID=218843 RepID=A0A9Q0F8Q7_9ROSI|nr:hypothetical protein Tsubulata_023034 [Turnera subulata]